MDSSRIEYLRFLYFKEDWKYIQFNYLIICCGRFYFVILYSVLSILLLFRNKHFKSLLTYSCCLIFNKMIFIIKYVSKLSHDFVLFDLLVFQQVSSKFRVFFNINPFQSLHALFTFRQSVLLFILLLLFAFLALTLISTPLTHSVDFIEVSAQHS